MKYSVIYELKVLVAVGFIAASCLVCVLVYVKRVQAARHRAGNNLLLSRVVQGQTSAGPCVYIGVHRDEARSDPDPDLTSISFHETSDSPPVRPANIAVGPNMLELGPIVAERIKSLNTNKRNNAPRAPLRLYSTTTTATHAMSKNSAKSASLSVVFSGSEE